MTEEEQEKLYKLLFKDTKNKLETIIEKLRIANAELRDELDKKNSEIEKQQKEIEDLQIIADDIKGHNIIYTDTPEFEEKFISKDKIREKIKEYQNKLFQDIEENKVVEYENIIQVLEELFKEE